MDLEAKFWPSDLLDSLIQSTKYILESDYFGFLRNFIWPPLVSSLKLDKINIGE